MIKLEESCREEPLFRIRELTTIYGDQVVHDRISFDIQRGELLTIIGLNGQGKTTLIKNLSRREIPQRGQIFFEGNETARFNDRDLEYFRRRLGYVFQGGALFTTNLDTCSPATALDNVSAPLRLDDEITMSESEITDRAKACLKIVGVREVDFYKHVKDLSGGTKKRIAIAREIICNPEVIMFFAWDEGLKEWK